MSGLRLGALVAVLLVAGCGSPRPLSLAERPADRVATPTSAVHYRDYATADALAAAMRWTEGAPVWVSAHRGGPVRGLVENSVEAFENALNHAPALIEADVRRTADGVLVMMHDETVDRTTTGTGRVDRMTLAQVRALRLVTPDSLVTSFRVPTLAEAMAWAEGRAVLLLDAKRDVPRDELVAAIRAARAEDQVAVITYSLDQAEQLHALAPDLVLSVTAETPDAVDALLASGIPTDRMIGWTGVGVPDPEAVARFHAAGVRAQAGAFGAIDAAATAAMRAEPYLPLLDTGADVISTDNVPMAAIAAREASLSRREGQP
ncbi:MAG: glycerophosphodiester phosphodiesterase family protein [Bacteroidota bacterium]